MTNSGCFQVNATPGTGSFIQIGVGACLRPAGSTAQDPMTSYQISDAGAWTVTRTNPSLVLVRVRVCTVL